MRMKQRKVVAYTLGPWRVGFEPHVTNALAEANPSMLPVVGPHPPFALGGLVALVPEAGHAHFIAEAPVMLETLKTLEVRLNLAMAGCDNLADREYLREAAELAQKAIAVATDNL